MTNKIGKNIIWIGVSEICMRGALLFANLYMARILGVGGYGALVLAQAVVNYGWIFVDAGTTRYGIREVSRNRDSFHKTSGELMGLRIFNGLIVFSVYVLVVMSLSLGEKKESLYLACGVYLIIYSFNIDWVYKGLEAFKYLLFGNALYCITYVGGLMVLLRGEGDLVLAAILWSFAYLPVVLYLYLMCSSWFSYVVKPLFRLSSWRIHLGRSIYFSASSVFLVVAYQSPLYVIAYYLSDVHLGIYSAPFRLLQMMNGVAFLLVMAFYPSMSRSFDGNFGLYLSQHRLMRTLLLAVGGVGGGVGWVYADEIIDILYGAKYDAGVGVFRILSLVLPLFYFRTSCGLALHSGGRQADHTKVAILGAGVGLITSFVLIDRFGVIGAAWALLLTELVLSVAMYYYMQGMISVRKMGRRSSAAV